MADSLPAVADGPPPASSPAPAAAARDPMVRVLGDLGSWSLGEPLADGSGEVILQVRIDALEELLITLGGDGLRALIAVLRSATPVRAEGGGARLELPGYSGAWLREQLGLSERAAYRASAALQEAGLLTTASMPGVRGAQGKQRAVLSGLVGLPGGAEPVQRTRRGRRSGAAVPPNLRNRETVASAVSTDAPVELTSSQVRAVSTEPRNRSTSSSEVGSTTSLPSNEPPGAEACRPGPDAARTELGAVCEADSWSALRTALAAVELNNPGFTASLVRPIVAERAATAGALVKALRLDGEAPVAVLAAHFLARVLLTEPVPGAEVWRVLATAGVVVPAEDPALLLARLTASLTAGLDAKVSSWAAWLGSGLRRPALTWTPTDTPRRLRAVLDAAYRGEVCAPAAAPVAAPAAAPGLVDDLPPVDAARRAHRSSPTAHEELDEATLEHLEAAVAASAFADRGTAWVAARKGLARGLVAGWLAEQSADLR